MEGYQYLYLPSIVLGILCLLIYFIFIKTLQGERKNAPFFGGDWKSAKGVTFRSAGVKNH